MKSIFIGVASIREDNRFLESYSRFLNSIKEKDYAITIMTIKDKNLPYAQNIFADYVINDMHDYLLLLDDDHWGHTKAMLDCLVKANAYMATIKSYSRHYPYTCTLMKRLGNSYAGIENGKGYQECDMTGFPMTLIKRDLFLKLEKPYFRGRNDGGRDWATDREFCERIAKVGVKPIGCFQHCLPHSDITEENVMKRREDERFINNNIASYMLLNKRTKILQGV